MSERPPEAATAETRRLAAIMFTDIVGFSRQMGNNEARMLRLLATHNQLIQQTVAAHHGTVIKTVGDAFLVDFPSVVQGYFNYHAVPGNMRTLGTFRRRVLRLWRRQLRLRSQKTRMNWQRFGVLIHRWIPTQRILHPFPSVRFDATHPR